MITLRDTMRLSWTKLRARKIRTISTILLAGMLFGVLVGASLVTTGLFSSVDIFREDGLTSRYIVSVSNSPPDNPLVLQNLMRDPQLVAEAKKRYQKIVAEKTAEAERLGVQYSSAVDAPPYSQRSDGEEGLNVRDPNNITRELLREYYSDQPVFDEEKFEAIAKRYSAIDFFAEERYEIPSGSSLTALDDGKEIFDDEVDVTALSAGLGDSVVSVTNLVIMPSEITDSFLLPDNANWQADGSSLPIILPQNVVERLLGMDKLADDAPASERLDRLTAVRSGASDLSIQMCYRNSASWARVQHALQQQKEIAANKDSDNYVEPTLIYGLPDPSKCGNAKIVSDTRTEEQKELDENQKLFDQKFGKEVDPESRMVIFKVVGVSPAEATQDGSDKQIRSASDFINNLLSTSSFGQAIPRSLFDKLPNKDSYADLLTFTPLYLFGNEDNRRHYVEFANATDAQRFIDDQACSMQYDNTCQPEGRRYMAMLMFSNSAAIDDIKNLANRWFGYGMISVTILAIVIMWIAVSRVIADGRRETAVFRAIGFKRRDIASVYILYTVLMSMLIALFAVAFGWIGALSVNRLLSPNLTAQAQYAFGGLDVSKEVSLMGIDQQQLTVVVVVCLATGLLSMAIPLINNVRRNPVRDMRDE